MSNDICMEQSAFRVVFLDEMQLLYKGGFRSWVGEGHKLTSYKVVGEQSNIPYYSAHLSIVSHC